MSLTPAQKNLTIFQGDTFALPLRFRTKNADGSLGAYIDLSGFTPKAQIRVSYDTAEVMAEFAVTLADQATFPGQLTLTLTPVQTAAIATTGGVWDFQLTDSNGDIQTYLRGTVTLTREVTHG